jgi:hypothetical protein
MRTFLLCFLFACASTSPPRSAQPLPTTFVGTGHPYWKQLALEARGNFALPEGMHEESPEGCFHLTAAGTIVETKLARGTTPGVDGAMKRALDAVMQARNAKPVPVPPELVPAISSWICVHFEPAPEAAPVAQSS